MLLCPFRISETETCVGSAAQGELKVACKWLKKCKTASLKVKCIIFGNFGEETATSCG